MSASTVKVPGLELAPMIQDTAQVPSAKVVHEKLLAYQDA